MQKFNKAAIVVATAVAGLVLAGCGGGGTASGPLKIGSLLPETGSLAFLGPPEFAGVDLAVADINAAGGVLGENIEHIRGDFKEYLQTNKKPFMANFYKIQRIKFNILMKSKNEP